MRNKKESVKLDRTEESVYTLFCLKILAEQACETLFREENIFLAEFDYRSSSYSDLMDSTIREALVYQILPKACAFIDEWDKFFGVKTEPKDLNKIRTVKRIAKPAHKCITSWKQLREFRNQAIAHNHRDKQGKNIYLNKTVWHSPQSDAEIYLLALCIKTMADIAAFYFPTGIEKPVSHGLDDNNPNEHRSLSNAEIKAWIVQINADISRNLHKEGAFDGFAG